jgi:protein phosphatase
MDEGTQRPFTIIAASDRGSVRERNEDYFGIYDPEHDELWQARGVLIVVSDGMGGHFSGADASKTAVEVMGDEYYRTEKSDAIEALEESFRRANMQVFERVGDGRRGLAGTTCTAVALFPDHINIAHAGDSRAYIIRKKKIKQITDDHSVVGEMMKQGMLSKEEARNHPRRNVITRAVGLRPEVEIDIYESIPFRTGDTVLVCSDGLFSMVSEEDILSIALGENLKKACSDLVKKAKDEGGHDNITVVLARRF